MDNTIEMQTEKKYKIYSVKKFLYNPKEYDPLDHPILFNVEDLVKELEEYDADYYFRVHKNTQYTFFGDVDGVDDFNEYVTKFINFMANYYNVEILKDDISFTYNKGKMAHIIYQYPN